MRNFRQLGAVAVAIGAIGLVLAPVTAHAQKADSAKAVKAADSVKAAAGKAAGKAKAAADSVAKKGKKGKVELTSKAAARPYAGITFAKDEKPVVTFETSMGTMVVELWPDVALQHCQSMVHLVETGFYDSLTFHRIIDQFVIQGGCPQGTGFGGPGYNVPAEFNKTPHDFGILSMARGPDDNSAGSQFFLCLSRQRTKALDGEYTVFGKLIEGEDVLRNIGKVKTSPGNNKPVEPVTMTKVTVKRGKK